MISSRCSPGERFTLRRPAAGGTVVLLLLALSGCGSRAAQPARDVPAAKPNGSTHAIAPVRTAPRPAPRPQPHAPFAVGEQVVTYIDNSRTVQFPGTGPEPRKLVTLIRYPAVGPSSSVDATGAAPARAAGPFPLVIFGHGFAVSPTIYAALLQAWARAGYVVAAPIFPLENADAPGGPDERDLINQPRDMSFVITQMLHSSADPHSFLYGLVNRQQVAVTGQSDGGETALAVAYDRYFIDRRVKAAVILSGAEIPGTGGFDFPAPSPPLLATQGTADTVNPPSFTNTFFDIAPAPKYLLTLFGETHLPAYTDGQPQLGIVERVTIAFLDRYLKGVAGALGRMASAGDVPGVARLSATP